MIPSGTMLANLLIETDLIIWDEAPMTHKYAFEALDRSLRDIMFVIDPSIVIPTYGYRVEEQPEIGWQGMIRVDADIFQNERDPVKLSYGFIIEEFISEDISARKWGFFLDLTNAEINIHLSEAIITKAIKLAREVTA